MAKQQTIEFQKPVSSSPTPEEPLHLDEMLTLIKSAHDLGYNIKAARDMKSLYDVISSDLYSVWYAIENELAIFTDNVRDLIEFTGWQREKKPAREEDTEDDLAIAS